MENGVDNSTFYILHSTFSKRAGEGAVVSGFVGNRFTARLFNEIGMGGEEGRDALAVLLWLVGTCGIDEAAARCHVRSGGGQDGILLRHKAFQPFLRPAPARIGAAAQHARIGAGRIDQYAIERTERSWGIFGRADGFYPIKMKTSQIRTQTA